MVNLLLRKLSLLLSILLSLIRGKIQLLTIRKKHGILEQAYDELLIVEGNRLGTYSEPRPRSNDGLLLCWAFLGIFLVNDVEMLLYCIALISANRLRMAGFS